MALVITCKHEINGYTHLSKLAEDTNIVEVLNTWKEGCGDKLMQYADSLLLCIKPLFKYTNGHRVFTGEAYISNLVTFIRNNKFDTAVMHTSCLPRHFDAVMFVSTASALKLVDADVPKRCGDSIALDDYIDDLVKLQEGGSL